MKVEGGVPQGDSLSSFCFCLAIEPVIKAIVKEGFQVISYMDDLNVAHREGESERVIELCNKEVEKIGLEVNATKCKTTENEGKIKFLGHEFSHVEPISIGEKLYIRL